MVLHENDDMEVKIDDSELKKIKSKLNRITKAFDIVTTDKRFLNSVGQLLVSRGKQNLEDGGAGGKSYQLLKPATRHEKSRKGFSSKPLQRTGQMKRSLSHELEGSRLLLTGRDIIKHHQWGAPKINLPKREVYTLEKDDEEEIKDFLTRRFKELIKDK